MIFESSDEKIIAEIAKESGLSIEKIREFWNFSINSSEQYQSHSNSYSQRDTAIIVARLMAGLDTRHPFSLLERITRFARASFKG